MRFYLGCAVWSFKGWVGSFYPSKSQPKDFLHLYTQRLTAVEGNTTFYAVPSQETIKRWADRTPPEFRFCLKLPSSLTHTGLLQPSVSGTLDFIKRVEGLKERLGPIFAQLPPHYSPEYLEDLTAFLEALADRHASLAVEVRHPDWFKQPCGTHLEATLKEFGVGQVLLDARPIYSANDSRVKAQNHKPNLPLQPRVTANFSIVRFISHPQPEFNQPFLEEWVKRVDCWLRQGTQIYFFVHCPVEERSPHTARRFQQLLEERGVAVPPLPWNQLNAFGEQLSLF